MQSLGKINQVTQYFGTLSLTHVGDMEIQLQCILWLWQLIDVRVVSFILQMRYSDKREL